MSSGHRCRPQEKIMVLTFSDVFTSINAASKDVKTHTWYLGGRGAIFHTNFKENKQDMEKHTVKIKHHTKDICIFLNSLL